MLEWLRVRNVALIREASLEFGEGLNVVTGETGAGKSVLLESLVLVLGGRAQSQLVGRSADRSAVEAGFRIPKGPASTGPLYDLLEENGVEVEDGELVVRRELRVRSGGQSLQGRIRVNGVPMAAGAMRRIGSLLAEVFRQGEHLGIQQPGAGRDILDRIAGNADLRHRLANCHDHLRAREEELTRLETALAREASERDTLTRISGEIESAGLAPGEDEELHRERRVLTAAGQLRSLLAAARDSLHESEDSATTRIAVALRSLERAAAWDPDLEPELARYRDALAVLEELALDLREREERIAAAPERLDWIEDRLALIRGLERRYAGGAGGADALLARINQISLDINEFENRTELRERLRREVAEEIDRYGHLAQRLSSARAVTAAEVGGLVETELASLGMGKARFEIEVAPIPPEPERPTGHFRPHGIDRVEFRFGANRDVPPGPIGQIASGGESSRFLVALTAAVTGEGDPPLVVFDEADAGTSGRIAHQVGARLLKLARERQVISVTHLPQVAAFGHTHLVVEKLESDGSVRVRRLAGSARIEEIARMLAGSNVTGSARDHACQLLAANRNGAASEAS